MMDVRASRVASSWSVSRGMTAVENQVTSLVDALPDIVWTALPDGNVDFLNQPWYDFTGLRVDHAYGQNWQAAIHPADLAELLDRWRAILASGEPGDWRRAYAASTESFGSFCSAPDRYVIHPGRLSNGTE